MMRALVVALLLAACSAGQPPTTGNVSEAAIAAQANALEAETNRTIAAQVRQIEAEAAASNSPANALNGPR